MGTTGLFALVLLAVILGVNLLTQSDASIGTTVTLQGTLSINYANAPGGASYYLTYPIGGGDTFGYIELIVPDNSGNLYAYNLQQIEVTGNYGTINGNQVFYVTSWRPLSSSTTSSSSESCTSTMTVTLTSGQPYPPLALPPPGSCYASVTVPPSPIVKALTDFWNWLQCLFGYCAT